jgi:methionine biosynthesis protein MetW
MCNTNLDIVNERGTRDMKKYTETGYDLIIDLIPEHSRVLDLGCGNGELLEKLKKIRKIKGFGVEISEEGVCQCVEKGLYAYQGDIDEGLSDYKDNSFDFVILNQTLQSTKRPEYVIQEIMRIGKTVIISFPNFGYYRTRIQLLCKGVMPKNSLLPYEWYESPNIHHLTIKDFAAFCARRGYPVEKKIHFSQNRHGRSRWVRFMPNLRAEFGFVVLNGVKFTSRRQG